MFLLLISFLAGILTVLAPCTLPLLPVIIGSSVAGGGEEGFNFRKAITITVSLGLSVILFTLVLKVSTIFINIPQSVWQIISGVIILVFGLISLFPELWERLPFVAKLNVDANKAIGAGYQKKSFFGDVIIGASLGPVFSTCSPTYFIILATVLPQSFLLGLTDLLSYALGLTIVLLAVALLGQKIVSKLGGISDTRGWFKRTLGAIFVIIGILVIFGIDKRVEASLSTSGLFDITTVEQHLLELNDKNDIASSTSNYLDATTTEQTVASTTASGKVIQVRQKDNYPMAPEITDPSGFINTGGQPISIGQYRGKKVVLIDIWTYSCINCQRTIPYLKAWYSKYEDQGLVIIGIHTPEFAFEKVQSNVEAAVKQLGITYPVVLDNNYATWNAFGNQYWPRKYLINVDGEIVYDHIGEGNYDVTEKAIQKALTELHQATGDTRIVPTGITTPSDAISTNVSMVGSQETYFGSERNQFLANGTSGKTGEQVLTLPDASTMQPGALYLDGSWNFAAESATNETAAKIVYNYSAKNVYMVGSSDLPNGVTITIKKDGIVQGTMTIKDNKLYPIIQGTDYGTHTLEIDVPTAGLNAFTFTFG